MNPLSFKNTNMKLLLLLCILILINNLYSKSNKLIIDEVVFKKMIEPFDVTDNDSITFDNITYPNIDKFVACDKTPSIYVNEISNYLYYSEDVYSKGIEGKVIAKVLVSPEGKIIKAFVEYTENEALNLLTLEAIYHYNANSKISPATQRGKNISLWISIPFTFILNKTKVNYKNVPDPEEFIAVEREPGVDINAISRNVIYPEEAIKEGIEGKVIIKVLVLKDGSIKNPIVEYSDNSKLNQSAIDAIMLLKTITPAEQKGKPVDCWVSIPINFKLK